MMLLVEMLLANTVAGAEESQPASSLSLISTSSGENIDVGSQLLCKVLLTTGNSEPVSSGPSEGC